MLKVDLYFKEKKISSILNDKNMIDVIEKDNEIIICALTEERCFKQKNLNFRIEENTLELFEPNNDTKKLTECSFDLESIDSDTSKAKDKILLYPLNLKLELELEDLLLKNKDIKLKLVYIEDKEAFLEDFKTKLSNLVDGNAFVEKYKNDNPIIYTSDAFNKNIIKEIIYDLLKETEDINNLMFLDLDKENPLNKLNGFESINFNLEFKRNEQ